MKITLQVIITALATINLLMTWFALFQQRQPTKLAFWIIRVFISTFSPILFLTGLLIIVLGLALNSLPVIVLGSFSALLYLLHVIKITEAPETSTGFEQAFGPQWESDIPKESKDYFLSKRYVFRLPNSPESILNQNISFYTISGTNRQLLCDVWQPPQNIKHSGLAFIYLHGSAWTVLDKDYGTRTFFKHLAQQGHVIMDVAYRLFPETDFMGMVHDAKHAIAWMKANAAAYDVNPDRIVIGGGSAGGHIALLAAYTHENKQFTPIDLEGVNVSVQGVISLYGLTDLTAFYYYTWQHLAKRPAIAKKKNGESAAMPKWIQKSMGKNFHRLGFDKDEVPGMLAPILGGDPDEKPEVYSRFSPITYVYKGCPSTLLIQGEHDIIVPAKATRILHSRLTAAGVSAVMHILPQTDHAFDLILPKISPSAHNAIYDVERFLALQVKADENPEMIVKESEEYQLSNLR
jgi:acetyl esterase/lipase